MNDPLDKQTAALEGFGIPTAMIQSHAPEIRFGDGPLIDRDPDCIVDAARSLLR